jgi:hypothetical protein
MIRPPRKRNPASGKRGARNIKLSCQPITPIDIASITADQANSVRLRYRLPPLPPVIVADALLAQCGSAVEWPETAAGRTSADDDEHPQVSIRPPEATRVINLAVGFDAIAANLS